MGSLTIYLNDELEKQLKVEAGNQRLAVSKLISNVMEDYLNEESDDAILERVNQVENKLDQYVDKLTLIDSRLNGLSLQLEKLKIPT